MARTKATARVSKPRRSQRNAGKAALIQTPPIPTQSRILRSHTAAAQKAATQVPKKAPKRRAHIYDPWTPKRKVNSNPRPRPPPRTHFTCRICIEEQPTSEFPKWIPPRRRIRWQAYDVPSDCIPHLARNPRSKQDPVCKSCIGSIMSARLDTVGARKVTGCVDPACTQDWNWDYIMRYLPKGEPLEKFNMDMFEVWKHDITPKLIECISPTCNAFGLPEISAPGYPEVSCHECSMRTCAQCLVPWHKDLTCAEYAAKPINDQMSDPEKDTLKLMQTKDGKRCPNCFLVIEKDGGCDSMLCLGCNKYFNWAAAASAVPGANKAQPFIRELPYWQLQNGTVTCEMDALNPPEQMAATMVATAA